MILTLSGQRHVPKRDVARQQVISNRTPNPMNL